MLVKRKVQLELLALACSLVFPGSYLVYTFAQSTVDSAQFEFYVPHKTNGKTLGTTRIFYYMSI